ncbi:MAG: hypothetical protein JWQ66_4686 [Mucilaginibacter sp.]|nr:hypothetical protein [Mucilaginibacter sp.]
MAVEQQQLLNRPIEQLPVSENFYLRCKLMGYECLRDVVEAPVDVLLAKEDFNYGWLGELAKLMTSLNILHSLQPIPGSNAY